MKYDSKAEQEAAEFIEKMAGGYRKAGEFEFIDARLFDTANMPFKAVLDFIPHDPEDCTIEFKTTGLNSRKSKLLADYAVVMTTARGYERKHRIHQKFSWSNSAYKHGEQHAKLPPLRHITTFSKWPTYREIKLYLKLGILFCHTSALEALNSACKMARAGFEINFQQVTPEGIQVTFPLNSMYRHQCDQASSRTSEKYSSKSAWPLKKLSKAAWQNTGINLK
ncbi:hypothetical protein GJ698_16450 [Pseudoduganella sp. FT26W]|uniref:Uncharacterized protein n=1 Tax=Duganella aquatilis TaxID=2666082 RepID=A0A844DA38_9BURK|nr:hypothetical protein [Duganella aquatilis]MRW85672.1 hypothetical protein [Duganella aquatilis]